MARVWDPMVTVGFLVFGLINVTQTVAVARDLGALLDGVFMQEGWGEYSTNAVSAVVGPVVIAVNVLSLVLAIGFAVPRLRARRTAFWIPLICAAVAVLLTVLLLLVAVFADPAAMAALSTPAPTP